MAAFVYLKLLFIIFHNRAQAFLQEDNDWQIILQSECMIPPEAI